MGIKYTIYPNLEQIKERPRNLIICIDDGWDDPELGNLFHLSVTNILRFANTLLRDTPDQFIRYIPGYASLEAPNNLNIGWGHLQLRDEAFVSIVEHYRPGDKIFLFGGGRGAGVALSVAHLLMDIGVPESLTYVSSDNGRVVQLENPPCTQKGQVKKHIRNEVTIEMLGLWDMFESLVIPPTTSGIVYKSPELVPTRDVPKAVKYAYHLVAIDDHREVFTPALLNQGSSVEEVWFMGVHEAVVGGGRERKLSDITLDYMVKRGVERGLKFHQDSLEDISDNAEGLGILSCEDIRPTLVRTHRDIFTQVRGRKSAKIKPKIHFTVFERMRRKPEYNPPNIQALKGRYEIVGKD